MDKILLFFGLCRIKKVKNVTATMHRHFVACVQNGVESDFGVKPKPGYLPNKCDKWWKETFKDCMAFNSDDINITSEPKFSELCGN